MQSRSEEESKSRLSLLSAEDAESVKSNSITTHEIKLYNYTALKNEKAALAYLDALIDLNPDLAMRLARDKSMTYDFESNFSNVLLTHVVSVGFLKLTQKLVEMGADVNNKGLSNDHGHTPLMIACNQSHAEVVEYLLEKGADISIKNKAGLDISYYIKSFEILRLIVVDNYVNEKDCLFNNSELNHHLLQILAQKNDLAAINTLVMDKKFVTKIDFKWALHYIRVASWDYPENRKAYEAICKILKTAVPTLEAPTINFNTEVTIEEGLQIDAAYVAAMYLNFGVPLYDAMEKKADIKNKADAIKSAIGQLNALICTPKKCVKFFQHVNAELIEYLRVKYNKAPEVLNPDQTKIIVLEGTSYRIPSSLDYRGINKNHAFSEVLIAMLKRIGFANNTYKWVGTIPTKIAASMLRQGDYCTENKLGIGFLTHGKVSHMLHILLCAYFIETGMINTNYLAEDGTIKQISFNEFFDALFIHREPKSGSSLFRVLFDMRFKYASVGDPHRLTSILTTHAHLFDCRVLGDYATDSLCRGFLRLMETYNENRDEQDAYKTIDDFVADIGDVQSHLFDHSTFVSERSMARARAKYPTCMLFNEPNFIMVKKSYNVDPSFTPRAFK